MSFANVVKRQAMAALEERSKIIAELRSVEADSKMNASEKRERIDKLDGEARRLEAEAREAIEVGERLAEVRELAAKDGGLTMPGRGDGAAWGDEGAWRSIIPTAEEYRTLMAEGSPGSGGYAVPAKVADRAVEFLRTQSVFMRVPGLNIHRFDGGSFILPSLNSTTMPGVVAEGAKIPGATPVFGALTFTPIKYADLYEASNELIEDATLSMRDLIFRTMTANIATQVDRDAFQGAGGATALTGLTKAGMGTAVNLATGNTVVKWDHIIDAYSDIEAVGASPAVIWASPDMGKALRKERENGANGGYLAGQVTDRVTEKGLGLPIHVSANLPNKTVIVADPARVHVGLRSDLRLAVSGDYGFSNDITGFRATYRIAGLAVDAPAAVQVIKAAAS
ncbi:phage major capsid protein [Streptomyces sp. NPDC056154]|uniref:phage major capsid protein n=1 Tax=unclassified Streptomyces TaxID=2593676 RepID=UPI0035D8D605